MKHLKTALLLMVVLGLAGLIVSLSFAGGGIEGVHGSKALAVLGENFCSTCHDGEEGLKNAGRESEKGGPTISFTSTGWDGTKSFYQVAGTATFSGGGIDAVEYFIDDGDIPGTGVPITGGSGLSPMTFTFSIRENALKSGDNTICVHALSSTSVWGSPTCFTATK